MKRREFMTLVGAAAARPFAARAQQDIKVARIAIMHPAIPVSMLTETGGSPIQAFFAELRRLGYVEGSNLAIGRHSGKGIAPDGLADLAKYVVSQTPDLIVTLTWYVVGLLKEVTNTMTPSPPAWPIASRAPAVM